MPKLLRRFDHTSSTEKYSLLIIVNDNDERKVFECNFFFTSPHLHLHLNGYRTFSMELVWRVSQIMVYLIKSPWWNKKMNVLYVDTMMMTKGKKISNILCDYCSINWNLMHITAFIASFRILNRLWQGPKKKNRLEFNETLSTGRRVTWL